MTTVYRLLGIDFALHKLQSGQELVILGIVYDLKVGRLGIKPERREKLLKNLDAVLQSNELTQAEAAKIKGRLSFVASHVQGRHGRAFFANIVTASVWRITGHGSHSCSARLTTGLEEHFGDHAAASIAFQYLHCGAC